MPTPGDPSGLNPPRKGPAVSPQIRIPIGLLLALVMLIMASTRGAIAQQPAGSAPAGCTHKNGRICPRCDRDDLWIVVEKCLAGTAKCVRAEPSKRGYIVVQDISPLKPVAYLLIPTKPVSGVDDAEIFKEPVVNFWQYALEESKKYPGPKPNHTLAMAINAECARSEGQLHIHISCARGGVVKTLNQADSKIGFKTPASEKFPGIQSEYQVIKVRGLTGKSSPFEGVRKMLKLPNDIRDQGIAVIASDKPGEFYVLSTTYHEGKGGGGAEELLDQSCAEQ